MKGRESILVLGGTGRQGGAAARHLLAAGWQVRALVRDPATTPALALGRAGAQLIRGDLDDVASLREAMRGVHGVFSVQTFMGAGGIAAEVRQGKLVAQTAAETGVYHFLYSSVGGAERDSSVPHFQSKWEIECHIRDLNLPATILRPAFFMENFSAYGGPRLVDDTLVLRQALRPDTALQMVAVDDIGAFTALVFDNPDDSRGAALELAGDELTGPQMAAVFGELAGMTARFEEQPLDEVRAVSDDLAAMYEFFNAGGYQANIESLRTRHPQLKSLLSWATHIGWTMPGTRPATPTSR